MNMSVNANTSSSSSPPIPRPSIVSSHYIWIKQHLEGDLFGEIYWDYMMFYRLDFSLTYSKPKSRSQDEAVHRTTAW